MGRLVIECWGMLLHEMIFSIRIVMGEKAGKSFEALTFVPRTSSIYLRVR